MGRRYDVLDDRLRAFLADQQVFFVATAPDGTPPAGALPEGAPPDGSGGHVNVSPKGYRDTFAVLGETTVCYLDLTGSGVETLAHLRQNGRITLMFCAFDGPPRIVRLYGRGRAVLPSDPEWEERAAAFPARPGRRAVIVIELDRISDSCGYGVPRYDFVGERDVLDRAHARKSAEELATYHATRNAVSIDGLAGLPVAD